MKNDTKVIIAGAGLGGLTAAAYLLQLGFEVKVYEQSASLGEVGAGIQSSANAVKVLQHLGIVSDLQKMAVLPTSFNFRRFDTGEILSQIPLGPLHEQTFGAPYFHLHRADLHQLLVRRVQELDPSCISLNSKARSFHETDNQVILTLEDGREVSGDVLVGADGIKSSIRAQILGDTPVSYSGDIAWRAVVPAERLPADLRERVVTVWCGPKRHAVMYFVRAGALFNFGGCVEREQSADESWTQRRPWEELKADFAGWHQDIQSVIDAMDKESCYQWALNYRPPAINWSTQRATLLGDAAHPTLPYMAQGAAMAIEDGAVFSRCLAMDGSVPEALQRYQRNRIERTSRIVNESNEMRTLYRVEDPDEMRAKFAQKDIGKSRGQWLYSYDPLTVELV